MEFKASGYGLLLRGRFLGGGVRFVGGGGGGASIFRFGAENFETDFNNLITWNVFYIHCL